MMQSFVFFAMANMSYTLKGISTAAKQVTNRKYNCFWRHTSNTDAANWPDPRE
jgi:hypothetical protein